jgi:anaerobic magnesium-protoporphyrin IX monomethyl ester cyclase
VAAKLDLEGYPITVIDQRVDPHWKNTLVQALRNDPLCVGITSMTGSQILGALEASRLVRQQGRIPVIWGGVHSSLFPEQTAAEASVDAVIKGEGEITFYELVKRMEAGQSFEGLAGVHFRHNGEIISNPDRPFVQLDSVPDPAYHLVNVPGYIHQYFSEKEVLELESSRGCPYNCGFCYNAPYNFRLWRPLSPARVVDRLIMLRDRYKVHSFHFIDDSFFINKDRVVQILELIIQKNLNIKIGFQGSRVDVLQKMSEAEFDLMYRAGTRFLQFGVESGSPRILELINKKLNVEDVVAVNRRLGKYPELIPYYNFMCGFPGETKEDVFKTASLAWKLLQENRKTMVSPFHHFKPYPGTDLFNMAVSHDFQIPQTLEAWGHFDWTEAAGATTNGVEERLLKKLEMTSIFVDGKVKSQSDSVLAAMAAALYRPIARFRMRHNFYSLMPESVFFR